MKKNGLLSLVFALTLISGYAQKSNSNNEVAIAFYNLENLFDTLVDPDVNKILQDDFTPNGPKQFTGKRYWHKLENMAKVIADIGTQTGGNPPAVVGVCEVENRQVLEDLVKMPAIAKFKYRIAHTDSPDKRGIDVALLYRKKDFRLEKTSSYLVQDPEDSLFFTRNQLLVSGWLGKDRFHFLVGHWPSRRGGAEASESKRILAAQVGRSVIDSLESNDPTAKIIYMGDLNDNPTDRSVKEIMRAEGHIDSVSIGELFAPLESVFVDGSGTLIYRGEPFLFDQFLGNANLLESKGCKKGYYFDRTAIFQPDYLKQQEGKYSGYPFRTYVGNNWHGGYSDHLPVYLILKKMKGK